MSSPVAPYRRAISTAYEEFKGAGRGPSSGRRIRGRRGRPEACRTYGAGVEPASWRIESRSSSRPKTISVDTVKLANRRECTCVEPTVAPRASYAPTVSSTGTATVGGLTASRRSASFARRATRGVRLAEARVVDHLPARDVSRGLFGEAEQQCGSKREVAGGDDAYHLLPCPRVDLLVLVGRQAARAHDDGDAPVESRKHVPPYRVRVCVVDEHVGWNSVECLFDGREPSRIRAGDARDELEIVCCLDGLGNRTAGPACDAGDADSQRHVRRVLALRR
jgi:hypothetical protein